MNVNFGWRRTEIPKAARPVPTATDITCPLCAAPAVTRFFLGDFRVADCRSCHHRFSPNTLGDDHVARVYGDAYFFGGGDGYDDYLVEADLLRAQGRRYGALLSRYAAPGRALDVGSAAGFVQAGLTDLGWITTGLEPNGRMVAYAKEALGLDAVQGSLEDAPDWPPFQALCMIQVIGHFHNLGRALRSAAKLTCPGGLCLIEYWRRDAWAARLLGQNWHEYSPPSVLHWFTRQSLDTAMDSSGFSCIAAGKPKKYISGRHARSLLSHKVARWPLGRQIAAATTAIPAAAVFRYPAFDLEWRLYRRHDTAVI